MTAFREYQPRHKALSRRQVIARCERNAISEKRPAETLKEIYGILNCSADCQIPFQHGIKGKLVS
jgi:hypothetical protein